MTRAFYFAAFLIVFGLAILEFGPRPEYGGAAVVIGVVMFIFLGVYRLVWNDDHA